MAFKPISAVDAFGREMNPQGTWYMKCLSDNTVGVIRYSYERGGTEVGWLASVIMHASLIDRRITCVQTIITLRVTMRVRDRQQPDFLRPSVSPSRSGKSV